MSGSSDPRSRRVGMLVGVVVAILVIVQLASIEGSPVLAQGTGTGSGGTGQVHLTYTVTTTSDAGKSRDCVYRLSAAADVPSGVTFDGGGGPVGYMLDGVAVKSADPASPVIIQAFQSGRTIQVVPSHKKSGTLTITLTSAPNGDKIGSPSSAACQVKKRKRGR